MLKCASQILKKTYVGYTKDLDKRISLHNTNKGAKSTKGYKWIIIYKKKFNSKAEAMSYEYKLKNDKKKRLEIYNNC
jgi:putative endonuclease